MLDEKELPERLQHLIEKARHRTSRKIFRKAEFYARLGMAHMDLTSLGENLTPQGVRELCEKALGGPEETAAVCIPRKEDLIHAAREVLAGSDIAVVTVVNFPAGDAMPERVAYECLEAVRMRAQEVDVVFPYAAFLSGDEDFAHEVLEAASEACEGYVPFKVIFESNMFTKSEDLDRACRMAIESGASFLKTCTGMTEGGADMAAAAVMLEAIRKYPSPIKGQEVGIKLSGGVKTLTQVAEFYNLALKTLGKSRRISTKNFRIGASSLHDNLRAVCDKRIKPRAPGDSQKNEY